MNGVPTVVGLANTNDSEPLYARIKRTFGSAVFRAMQVAGKSEGPYPSKLSQQALSEQSGVARSTIAKFLDAKDKDNTSVNPDLRTLCKIAGALNVSPAMLLLTPDDWSRLAQAAIFLREAAHDHQVLNISKGMTDPKSGPGARACAGLELARLFGVYRDFTPTVQLDPEVPAIRQELLDEQNETARRQRLGIFVATSIPPLRELPVSLHAPLLSLCANLGASTKLN